MEENGKHDSIVEYAYSVRVTLLPQKVSNSTTKIGIHTLENNNELKLNPRKLKNEERR